MPLLYIQLTRRYSTSAAGFKTCAAVPNYNNKRRRAGDKDAELSEGKTCRGDNSPLIDSRASSVLMLFLVSHYDVCHAFCSDLSDSDVLRATTAIVRNLCKANSSFLYAYCGHEDGLNHVRGELHWDSNKALKLEPKFSMFLSACLGTAAHGFKLKRARHKCR